MLTFINLNETKQNSIRFNEPGNYVIFFYNISGEYEFNIQSPNVNLNIFGLYVGKNNNNFSLQTVQKHQAHSSTSNLFIKGVFYDSSKFQYKGLVRIEKNAQKSHAYQKNQNLILSEKVFVQSKPYLEILTNDVFCTHGSTTGKLNKDEMYCLESRGIDNKAAQNLLVDGFINDIIIRVKERYPQFKFNLL